MMNGKKITYIFLDRGVEDVALISELNDIIKTAGMHELTKLFAKEYPTILKLKQGLQDEMSAR